MEIHVKSAEIRSRLFLKWSYEDHKPGRKDTLTANSDAPIHDDLHTAFQSLLPHLLLLTEQKQKPDVVINTASMTNVDLCETEKTLSGLMMHENYVSTIIDNRKGSSKKKLRELCKISESLSIGDIFRTNIVRIKDRENKIKTNKNYAWRLDVRAAAKKIGKLFWQDIRLGNHEVPVGIMGDVVIGRKDVPSSYHLASTLDDHIQKVGLVTRGEDLVESTHIHRVLQSILGLKTPYYFHHPLILDSSGDRLSKRTRAQTVRAMKTLGYSPKDVINLFGKKNLLSLLSLIKNT